MAIVYINSAASGSNNGTSKTNAFTSLAAAIAGGLAAGDVVYVAHTSDDLTAGATVTWNLPGTSALPNKLISVDFGGSTPPVAADVTVGAKLRNTGTFNLIFGSGYATFIGFSITAGDGSGTALIFIGGSNSKFKFKKCAFKLGSTGTS